MQSGLGKVLIRRRRRPPVPPGPLLFMPRLAAVNLAAADDRLCALGLIPGKFSRRPPADYVIIF